MEKANVLYIDEPINYAAFQSAFQPYYHIFTAHTAVDAKNILREQPIAVIICNQNLPGLSGIEFLESIVSEYPDSIRMLMADADDADLMVKAINKAHVFRYITKPWIEDELKQSIDVGFKICNLEKKNREYISQMHEESLKLERILNLLHKYTPGYAIGDVFTKGSDSLFKGESVKVTILHICINQLNQLIEKSDPHTVLNYLNNFFAFISRAIIEHKGFVNKFMDGTIVGIFGAPVSYMNNENNALFCGLEVLEKLNQFNSEFSKKINFETKVSIGAHSGESIVGNVGSDQYLAYTAIGEPVRFAALITDLASEDKTNEIIISQPIYDEVQDEFIVEPYAEKESHDGKKIKLYKVINKKM